MVASMMKAQNQLTIAELGTFEIESFELDTVDLEARVYTLSQKDVHELLELLGFTARFESDAIGEAHLDIYKSEAHISLEVKKNAHPQAVAVRYAKDRWHNLEVGKKTSEPSPTWNYTEYEAAFLSEEILISLSEKLGISKEQQQKSHLRIDIKSGATILVCEAGTACRLPLEQVSGYKIKGGRAEIMQLDEKGQNADNAAREKEVTSPSTQNGANEGESGISERKNAVPVPKAREIKSIDASVPVTYQTYSRSEIDMMLKAHAEKVTSLVQEKFGSQLKSTKDAMKDQDYLIKKTVDDVQTRLKEASKSLDKKAQTLTDENKKDLETAKEELVVELERIKKELEGQISPKIANVSKSLTEIREKHKEIQDAAGRAEKKEKKEKKETRPSKSESTPEKQPTNLTPVYVVVGLLVMLNGLLIWSAFDRINDLEKKQTDMVTKYGEYNEVPVPDLMGDKLKKEEEAGTKATTTETAR